MNSVVELVFAISWMEYPFEPVLDKSIGNKYIDMEWKTGRNLSVNSC